MSGGPLLCAIFEGNYTYPAIGMGPFLFFKNPPYFPKSEADKDWVFLELSNCGTTSIQQAQGSIFLQLWFTAACQVVLKKYRIFFNSHS